MQERLRRSGLRSIHPVVDVTNYVMLELGQPLHAFNLDNIGEKIQVRLARMDETLTLLDGRHMSTDFRRFSDCRPIAASGAGGSDGRRGFRSELLILAIFFWRALFFLQFQ